MKPALGIAAESPQRGTSEDLQSKARPLGEPACRQAGALMIFILPVFLVLCNSD